MSIARRMRYNRKGLHVLQCRFDASTFWRDLHLEFRYCS
eukprot:COSAG02_NODE_11568_length_1698_cov_1.270169_2_plen_38_part_01